MGLACLDWGARWAAGRFLHARGPSTFVADGEVLAYAHEPYNNTWLNERAVELALARRVLEGHEPARVLEVGNVLSHYGEVLHDVVDKYETAYGVDNVDVSDLTASARYDLVVSISTIEHVGLDEPVLDPHKPGRALERLREALAPGGLLWVTLPIGYNLELDRRLRAGDYGFTSMVAFAREPRRNVWRQVPVDEVWGCSYDRLLYTAHGLVVAEYRDPRVPAAQ